MIHRKSDAPTEIARPEHALGIPVTWFRGGSKCDAAAIVVFNLFVLRVCYVCLEGVKIEYINI